MSYILAEQGIDYNPCGDHAYQEDINKDAMCWTVRKEFHLITIII